MDFCNEENSWLVDYELVQAKTHFELDESYWAIPSISSLKNKIIEVYNLDKNIISKKLNLAKQTILENYSSKAVANRVKEALENYPNV
jgi:hypothetical protein